MIYNKDCVAMMHLMAVIFCFSGCARTGGNQWENLDYSKVYRENARRENDTSYVTPSVLGCTDDDLFNCRTR
jgi:hypothetical protein